MAPPLIDTHCFIFSVISLLLEGGRVAFAQHLDPPRAPPYTRPTSDGRPALLRLGGLGAAMGRDALTRGDMARTFFWIGLTSYGGPAIVAQIRQATVLRKEWLTEDEFAESLAFCQTLPGPIAVQTAAHIGWRLFGGAGACIALTCYIFPAFLLMVGLSAAYFRFGNLPLVAAVFRGLGAVVAGIVADSTLAMARPSLKDWRGVWIAAAAAAGFFAGFNSLLPT